MAIVKNVTVTVKDNKATLSEDIYAYIGDGGITLLISILEPYYTFGSFRADNLNVVEEAETQWANVCVLKPDNTVVTSDRNEIFDGKVKFEITKDFIDEIGEEGTHQLQIHLYDGEDESSNRLTIPPVPFHVIRPICVQDTK